MLNVSWNDELYGPKYKGTSPESWQFMQSFAILMYPLCTLFKRSSWKNKEIYLCSISF